MVALGPLYDLLVRMRLAKSPLEFMPRRIVVFALIAWLPLFVLSFLEGRALGAAVLAPIFPLLLTMFSVEQLLERLVKMLI